MAKASEATTSALEPSLSPGAFPAVTVPPSFRNAGLSLASALGAGVLPGRLVGRDGGGPALAGDLHRQNLGLELAGLRRLDRLPVALVGEPILVLPAHARLLRRVLGVLPHVAAAEGIPEPVVDHAVHHRLVAGLDPAPHAVHVVRRAGHGLLPAGDDAVGVAGLDRLGRRASRP